MLVRDVMAADPVTISAEASLRETVQRMLAEGSTYVVVVDNDGNPGGFFTKDDVLQTMYQAERPPADIRVISVAEPPELTVDPSMEVREAASQVTAENVSAALVMDRLDFEGVFSVVDIVEHLGPILDATAAGEQVEQP
ncbi:MAG: signal transduction protein [Halobacteriales archaeon SW_9_67_25]|jgi:CBS domain-containing protein|nr:MAG: signal transduction protein [Halobacteriales archaeon SW_9_67_25]